MLTILCASSRPPFRQVFVRCGLQSIVLDSPEQNDWANIKRQNASTRFGCQRCEVPQAELNNPLFDYRRNQRTAEGIDAKIDYAREGRTAAERAERERQHGVVIPKKDNPLKKLTFDRVLQSPFDVMHQDALASTLC